jgi:hypothetical protein
VANREVEVEVVYAGKVAVIDAGGREADADATFVRVVPSEMASSEADRRRDWFGSVVGAVDWSALAKRKDSVLLRLPSGLIAELRIAELTAPETVCVVGVGPAPF